MTNEELRVLFGGNPKKRDSLEDQRALDEVDGEEEDEDDDDDDVFDEEEEDQEEEDEEEQ